MKNHVIFSRLSLYLPQLTRSVAIQLIFVLSPFSALAQIISPNGAEVNFSYTASFEIPATATENTDEKRMKLHSSHLFGLFQSPNFIREMGLTPEHSAGIGAPKLNWPFPSGHHQKSMIKLKLLIQLLDA